jgi:hypothetical protein
MYMKSWPPVAILKNWLKGINVDNIPLLIEGVVSLEDDHVLVVSVSVSSNIECSSVLDVNNGTIVILEELPPSGAGVPDLEVA